MVQGSFFERIVVDPLQNRLGALEHVVLEIDRQPVHLALTAQAVLAPQPLLVAQPIAQLALGDAQRVADRRDIAVELVNSVERLDLLVQGVATVHPRLHFACRRL